MTWLWFLAGIVVRLAFGIVVVCTIVMDRELEKFMKR